MQQLCCGELMKRLPQILPLLYLYLSNLDEVWEVRPEFLPFEGMAHTLCPILPVCIFGICDVGRTNQRFISFEQFRCRDDKQ